MATQEIKGHVKNSIGRLLFAILSIALQIWMIVLLAIRLQQYYAISQLILTIAAIVLSLWIYNRNINSAYKLAWILIIMAYPIFGVCMYFILGNVGIAAYTRRRIGEKWQEIYPQLSEEETASSRLEKENKGLYNQSYYMDHIGHYPLYDHTNVTYYGNTIDAFKAQIAAMQQAKRYIFLEYFAIEDSTVWKRVEAVLSERVKAGVEVRVLYDDVGSIAFVNKGFAKHLQSLGIKCQIYNPVMPFLNVIMNNRDHRKIAVIDGVVGFTGGYNLADEYFNITHPYGAWKDSGVRLEGKAAISLTAIFLEMWDGIKRQKTNLSAYFPEESERIAYDGAGYVQPYADTPMDDVRMGENVYLNMMKNAKQYLYITTPYLILNDELKKELVLAAGRGVDVRIVTPGIPDKRIVYSATRSYYTSLARAGVRIYEYTPGFLHAKQMITDDEAAIVGTVNLDFRSLYLHFEDGCFFAKCDAVSDVKKDFLELFGLSEEVGEKYTRHRNMFARIWRCLMRFISPLI